MSAPIRIEAKALGDTRFKILGRLCGLADGDHALIKVARIWAYQTDVYTDECPSYVVGVEVIEAELGLGGADHLVTARLATAEPPGFRMHGTEGRIEWLYRSRKNGKQGGRPQKQPPGYPPGIPPGQPDANRPGTPLTLTLALGSDPSSSKTRKTEKQSRAREVSMPEGWVPTAEHGELATKLAVSVGDEAAAFVDFHRSKGSRFVDWNAAFRTWLRNAKKFSRPTPTATQPRGVGRSNPLPADSYETGDLEL